MSPGVGERPTTEVSQTFFRRAQSDSRTRRRCSPARTLDRSDNTFFAGPGAGSETADRVTTQIGERPRSAPLSRRRVLLSAVLWTRWKSRPSSGPAGNLGRRTRRKIVHQLLVEVVVADGTFGGIDRRAGDVDGDLNSWRSDRLRPASTRQRPAASSGPATAPYSSTYWSSSGTCDRFVVRGNRLSECI
jgi:hypothetical protein